jgi:hypothetical protein
MTIEQITDIAYEVVNELEPFVSLDVFDVYEFSIIMQHDKRLLTIALSVIDRSSSRSAKAGIKRSVLRQLTLT